jgi:autotransporter-associated beta strand protein
MAVVLAVLGVGLLHADDAVWNKAASGTYDWTNVVNWLPETTFPNGAGEAAGITNDITGGQTIQLRQNITVGTLAIGDAAAVIGSYGFTVGNNGSETYVLTFDSGAAGVPARLVSGSSGTPTVNLNAPMALSSDLLVNIGGVDSANHPVLSFGGVTELNGYTITFTNGVSGQNQITVAGDFAGEGTLVNNALTVVSPSNGGKAFGGRIVANRGTGGSNTGSFTLTNGGFTNAMEFIINGYLSNGNVQAGGVIRSGNNSAFAVNPGQRWTMRQVTLNGGNLDDGGQAAMVGSANDWQKGLEYVLDNVATVTLNSAYCYVAVNASSTTTGTILNVETLVRKPGSSAYMNGPNASNKLFLASNGTAYLRGTGGVGGPQTQSVIPWMGAYLAGNPSNPGGFATYVEGAGVRGLTDAEYATTVTAGAEYNVSVSSVSLASDTTVNALRTGYMNSSPGNNIGTNRTLTVASGGLFFQVGNKYLGVSGSPDAGTLNFGGAEGLVWVLSTTTNTIGAKITGTGGLTKTGTGMLTLTGSNEYSGSNHVSGGTLRMGDGTYASNLGSGSVDVHAGATLILSCSGAIADTATVSLYRYGLYNGRIQLDEGVNETVKFLYLAGSGLPSGTYGASGSGADNIRDDYFAGTGVLTVTGSANKIDRGTVISVR